MRKLVFIFLMLAMGGLLVAPLVNSVFNPNSGQGKWRTKEFLYNMDFLAEWPSFFLYQAGISTHPKQLVIGREGWLYLGDNYAQSRTVARNGQTPADLASGQKIGAASQAWEAWLKTKGVRVFRVMLGPNKESIYPEYLPAWAHPATPTATDALFAGTGTERFIDLRAALLGAKAMHPEALYYKTDTHWNPLGAGVAFRAFAQSMARSAPELHWPTGDAIQVTSVAHGTGGGDLASFQRIQRRLADSEPATKILGLPIETTQYDFDSRRIVQKGGNPKIPSQQTPLLVISDGALNAKKVLWLRDSFGTAMAPLMAATFSETVQLHWLEALKPEGRFVELVEKWKPDYVFITVVERDSRSGVFALAPPLSITGPRSNFIATRTTSPVKVNDIVSGEYPNEYRLDGPDPFIDYALDPSRGTSEGTILSVQLTCNDNTNMVPMQLFWLKEGEQGYQEDHSVKFTINPGTHLINLDTVPGWAVSGTVKRLRLDIDSNNTCLNLKLSNPELGTIGAR